MLPINSQVVLATQVAQQPLSRPNVLDGMLRYFEDLYRQAAVTRSLESMPWDVGVQRLSEDTIQRLRGRSNQHWLHGDMTRVQQLYQQRVLNNLQAWDAGAPFLQLAQQIKEYVERHSRQSTLPEDDRYCSDSCKNYIYGAGRSFPAGKSFEIQQMALGLEADQSNLLHLTLVDFFPLEDCTYVETDATAEELELSESQKRTIDFSNSVHTMRVLYAFFLAIEEEYPELEASHFCRICSHADAKIGQGLNACGSRKEIQAANRFRTKQLFQALQEQELRPEHLECLAQILNIPLPRGFEVLSHALQVERDECLSYRIKRESAVTMLDDEVSPIGMDVQPLFNQATHSDIDQETKLLHEKLYQEPSHPLSSSSPIGPSFSGFDRPVFERASDLEEFQLNPIEYQWGNPALNRSE